MRRLRFCQRVGEGNRIGTHLLLGFGYRVGTLTSKTLGNGVFRVEIHRIGTDEYRVALRCVVTNQHRVARQERIARLAPIFAPIAKHEHLLLRIVNLYVALQTGISAFAIVVERVAPQLLLLGKDVAVERKRVVLAIAAECSSVGIQVLVLGRFPDVGIGEELGVVGLGVVDDRIAHHFVCLVAHLHAIDTNNIFCIGVVVTILGFELIIFVDDHTAARKLADVGLCIEKEVVRVECRTLIDHLDDVGIYACLVLLTVVFGTVAVDVRRALIDKHVAEALDL